LTARHREIIVSHMPFFLKHFQVHKQSKRLVISASFPDVKGTLAPTVTTAFVNTALTIWRIKISTHTPKKPSQ